MFIFVNIFLLMLFTVPSFSAIYYVASGGNDNNNGLSPSSPWQSISKVNSVSNTFVAGDQILFNRGDKFFGEIKITKSGTLGNKLVYGSYGSGELPEITGKKTITNWILHSGNIYKAAISDTVTQLYISNKLMTIARFPNVGFLKIDVGNNKLGFYDAQLNQGSGYFTGSVCKVRTVNWLYEKKTVSAFSGGIVTFSTPSINQIFADYGYFFDNKLSFLDTGNEWFYDKAAAQLYFYAPGGVNPNTLNVEAVTVSNGVKLNINVANTTVQDMKLSGFSNTAVSGYTGNYNTVQRCVINKIEKYGIEFNGIGNNVYDNEIEDVLNNAVYGTFNQGEIKRNLINRTGMVAGYGIDGQGYYGILIWNANGTIIEENIIDSTGYVGINVNTSAKVRKNVISYSLLVLNDGGGISIGNANGLEISDNIISNSIGNTESSNNPVSYADGIYVNEAAVSNSIIQRNTVHSCRFIGILIDMKYPSVNNSITNNLVYNNFAEQIRFSDWSSSVFTPVFNTIVKGNTFYSLQSTQVCMKHIMFRSPQFSDYGDFDSNYYCNPYSDYVINRTMVYGTYSVTNYNLDNWKSLFNEDANSKTSLFAFSQYGITDTLSPNLITNSKFNSNISNWSTWPSGSTISQSFNPLLDSGSMKIRWSGVGNNEGFTMSNDMTVTKGSYYQLSFSCAGDQNGTFSVWGMSAGYSSFPAFFPFNYFSYGNSRSDYSLVVKADTSDIAARLSFDLILPDSLFYLDNVNFYKVSVNKIDSTQKSKLYVNDTDIPKVYSLNGITYKDLDGNPVTGTINVPAYSSVILVNDNSVLNQSLYVTAFPEGLSDQVNNTMVSDTCKVFLRNNFPPYSIVDSSISVLGVNGSSYFLFRKAVNGINYYIETKHRNSIETWSSNPVLFSNYNAVYDFSSSASQAFGNNLKLKGSKYCLFSGDVNQDGSIDASDMSNVENDKVISATGYLPTDLNGDYSVDASDLSLVENNSRNNIVKITP